MALRWLLRKLLGTTSRNPLPPVRLAKRRPSYRALLEPLEDRLTPALSVTTLASGETAQSLVNLLIGTGVSTSNVQFTGANVAGGAFTGDGLAAVPVFGAGDVAAHVAVIAKRPGLLGLRLAIGALLRDSTHCVFLPLASNVLAP